ncbi:hypothetical protein PR048_003141 [Dryococelus australis]|uniref:Uncharacterized protein n=1 Tax=Dryococelus australis TaxID=614101 RepID=A0ABQ9IMA6_9NEOP|nr:hypothetical protein PR048_003141 [Dryococelus australis]
MGRTYDYSDALKCIYRLRWYILGKHTSTAFNVNRNVGDDAEEVLTAAGAISNQQVIDSDPCCTADILKLVEELGVREYADEEKTIFRQNLKIFLKSTLLVTKDCDI